jgi:transcriptional regulator with XRE-family HTH domain
MTPDQLRVVGELRCLAVEGKARTLRKARRIGLRELARALNAHPSTVSRWETGQTAPRPEAALKWADFLGVTGESKNSDGVEESCQATSTPPIESPLASAN